jgi:hypothetical protein
LPIVVKEAAPGVSRAALRKPELFDLAAPHELYGVLFGPKPPNPAWASNPPNPAVSSKPPKPASNPPKPASRPPPNQASSPPSIPASKPPPKLPRSNHHRLRVREGRVTASSFPLKLALDRRSVGVPELEPVARTAADVTRPQPLRHDPLKAHLDRPHWTQACRYFSCQPREHLGGRFSVSTTPASARRGPGGGRAKNDLDNCVSCSISCWRAPAIFRSKLS